MVGGWSSCPLRRGLGTRAGLRKGDFMYKNRELLMARETPSPGGQGKVGDRLLRAAVQCLSLQVFKT